MFLSFRVIGLHLNMLPVMPTYQPSLLLRYLVGAFIPSIAVDKEDYNKVYPIKKFLQRLLMGTGYFHLQATKPDSIGYFNYSWQNEPNCFQYYMVG